MDSGETPAASSSRGTAIPPEATSAGGHGDRLEPTRGFELQIFPNIDPTGEHNVPIVAAQDDLPRLPAPQASLLDLASMLENEILSQFYEAEFQRLRPEHTSAHADDYLEEYYSDYNNNTDDDDDDVKDVMAEQGLHDQEDGSSENVVEEVSDHQRNMLQQSGTPGTSLTYVATCAPLNAVPQPSLPIGKTEIAPTDVSNPKMAVPSMEIIDVTRSPKRAAVEKVDGERAGVLLVANSELASPPEKRLAVEKVDRESTHSQGSSSSD